jgi:hypothetical protein
MGLSPMNMLGLSLSVRTAHLAQIMPILRILCYNGSVVTWTVVSLTTAKFKSLIFSIYGFTLSYTANTFILMILYDFCLLPAQFYWLQSESGSESYITTRFLLLSDSCGFDVGRSLWPEDGSVVYNCYWVLASAVIFGSESRGTRDHILLSQIRDLPFRRLLRLAGLRGRYSTPPPHESDFILISTALYIAYWYPTKCLLITRIHGNVFRTELISKNRVSAETCLSTRFLAMGPHVTLLFFFSKIRKVD